MPQSARLRLLCRLFYADIDLYLRAYLDAYPNAELYGAPSLVRWTRSLPFKEPLGDLAPPLWEGEIDQVHIQGIGLFLDEIVFYHRRSRSLIRRLIIQSELEGCVDH